MYLDDIEDSLIVFECSLLIWKEIYGLTKTMK